MSKQPFSDATKKLISSILNSFFPSDSNNMILISVIVFDSAFIIISFFFTAALCNALRVGKKIANILNYSIIMNSSQAYFARILRSGCFSGALKYNSVNTWQIISSLNSDGSSLVKQLIN